MILKNISINFIRGLVNSFYINGEHTRDRHAAEAAIETYLDLNPSISRKEAHDIKERCHDIMKHGHYRSSEAWNMIEKLLTEHEIGLYHQIKESVIKFYNTGSSSDRHEVQERIRDYLKHVVKLDEKTGSDSLRHKIVNEDIHDLLKYNRNDYSNSEDLWIKVKEIIDCASS